MKIYEGKSNYRPGGVGGGFRPVQAADVASAMRRENSARRSRDQAFYQSAAANDRTDIQNAQQYARDVKQITDDQLKAFSDISSFAKEQLYEREKGRIEEDMQNATMAAWADPLTVPQEEVDAVNEGVEATEQGAIQADNMVRKMEENGTSPIVTERFRAATAQGRLAYEQARAQRGGIEYGLFATQKTEFLNVATSLEDYAARQSQVAQEFLQTRGFMGTNNAFLAKYLFPAMKRWELGATKKWVAARETQLKADRKAQAGDRLFLGINSGNAGESAWNFIQTRRAQVGSSAARGELKTLLFEMAENGELSETERKAIMDYPITTDDGDNTTIGRKFGKDFQGLEMKIAQARQSTAQINLAKLEQRRADTLANFQTTVSEMQREGVEIDEAFIDKIEKDWTSRGLGAIPTEIKDFRTSQDADVEAWERKLDSIRSNAGRGYLIPADLEGAPIAIQDKYASKVDADRTFTSEDAKDIEDDAEDQLKRLTNQSFNLSDGNQLKTPEWGQAYRAATLDYRKIFNANVRSGKYSTLEDAKNAALAEVEKKFDFTSDRKYAGNSVYRQKPTVSTDVEYQRNLTTARKAILAAPDMVNNHILPGVSAQNIKDAEKFLTTGQGSMPRIFVDLAADSPKVTPWDLAQAQAKVLNPSLKIDTPQAEELVKKQAPYLQRLLNYKPSINRTTQAFTPDMNAPDVVNPALMKQVEGGALTGLTRDDFKWLAYAVTSEAERGTDDEYAVAASILNRLADPTWNRGARGVRDIIFASGQYEGVYKGMSWHDKELLNRFLSTQGQDRIVKYLRILQGRQDFKGVTQYHNMGAGDIKASSRGNFFHYTGQTGKGRWTGAVPTYWQRWIRS